MAALDRYRRTVRLAFALTSLLIAIPAAATAQARAKPVPNAAGAHLFQTRCASCHRPFNPVRAPWPAALNQMSRAAILATLETGVMRQQAAGLSHPQLVAIASFVGQSEAAQTAAREDRCPSSTSRLAGEAPWNGWGGATDNSRSLSAAGAGLTRDEIPELKVKWAFGIPGAASAGGQPTLYGGRLFLGGGDGLVYSLDARSGCVYWSFRPAAPARTAITIGSGGRLAYFGDEQGTAYAVHAATGSLAWKTSVDPHPFAMITGSPVLYGRRLYVPVSSAEEVAGAFPQYPCCTFRGSLAALDANTGKVIWKTFTIPVAPQPTRKNAAGTQMFAPSGAAIWSSPTIDPLRHAVYVATGDNYSSPATTTSDAIVALALDSGQILWVRQLTRRDSWNIGCEVGNRANCPEPPGWDLDIGAAPILRTLSNGKRILIVGQKSGVVYGLEPDRRGAVVWQTRIGKGGKLGGIEFGGAADAGTAYLPLSDYAPKNPLAGGGLFALNLASGDVRWHRSPSRPACSPVAGCSAAEEGPASWVANTVLLGSLDGYLRAYDARDGAVIWDFDALRAFRTVNGVQAKGGSFANAGPIAGLGMVFAVSGYSTNAGIPGNVLLAFSVDGR